MISPQLDPQSLLSLVGRYTSCPLLSSIAIFAYLKFNLFSSFAFAAEAKVTT